MRKLDPSIDFEWRSGTEINLGLPRYFADPESRVLCLAYDMADGLEEQLWAPEEPTPDVNELLNHVAAGRPVRAWNAMFEWYAWNTHMVPVHAWPELKLEQCVDSMHEAAALNLPQGLEKCGLALGLPPEQIKSKRGKELIQLLCVPQKEPEVHPPEYYKSVGAYKGAQTRHRTWLAKGGRWLNDPKLLQELYAYCRQDVRAEIAISNKLRAVSDYERRVWVQTQVINQRGIPIDVRECSAIASVVAAEVERLDEEMTQVTGGMVTAGTERDAFLRWVNANAPQREHTITVPLSDEPPPEGETTGYVVQELPGGEAAAFRTEIVKRDFLEDVQSETIERALLNPEGLAPHVVRALQIRAAVAQTSTSKLEAMLARVAADGTLKDMYITHGASTGRDASRGGVNMQNLASPRLTPDEILEAHEILGSGDHALASLWYGDRLMDAAVSLVRGVIKAPAGKIFYDADYSSIENRMSAWVADQQDKLDLFRQGLDEYKTIATKIFHVAYEAVTPAQRKFCKPAILGGMFGQGAKGLVDYAASMGVVLTMEESTAHTQLYRSEYEKVQALWYRCGDASIAAVQNPGIVFEAGKHLKLVVKNNFLFMKLPSGRLIAWAAPMVEVKPTPWGAKKAVVTVMQVDSFTKQWWRDKLIGSSIFQSAVQGSARDVLIAGMFNAEEGGYPVVMRTHDELTALVDEGFGSPDEMGRLMCQPIEWCSDLPLAYEAWASTRFRK